MTALDIEEVDVELPDDIEELLDEDGEEENVNVDEEEVNSEVLHSLSWRTKNSCWTNSKISKKSSTLSCWSFRSLSRRPMTKVQVLFDL